MCSKCLCWYLRFHQHHKTLNTLNMKHFFFKWGNLFITDFFIGRIGTYHALLKECYSTLVQPHCDVAYCVWYPNLSMSLKNGLQTAQNACIRFFLGMEKRSHIALNHFLKNNWLPVKIGLNNALRWWLTILKIASPLYICQIYIL